MEIHVRVKMQVNYRQKSEGTTQLHTNTGTIHSLWKTEFESNTNNDKLLKNKVSQKPQQNVLKEFKYYKIDFICMGSCYLRKAQLNSQRAQEYF